MAQVAALPESERLPDGSWVTGFRGADPDVITAAEHATIETIADMEAFRQALEGSV